MVSCTAACSGYPCATPLTTRPAAAIDPISFVRNMAGPPGVDGRRYVRTLEVEDIGCQHRSVPNRDLTAGHRAVNLRTRGH
jgi:hypothetical protein